MDVDAGVDALQRDEAARDEPRTDEHHERNGHLRDDEHAARTQIAARTHRSAVPLAKRIGDVTAAQQVQEGRGCHGEGNCEAQSHREREHRRVDVNLVRARRESRRDTAQKADPARRDEHAEGAADERKHEALEGELSIEPRIPRAEGDA